MLLTFLELTIYMTDKKQVSTKDDVQYPITWGPKVLKIAILVAAVFVWWLVFYSHGVTPSH
jgi:hypothetical protein